MMVLDREQYQEVLNELEKRRYKSRRSTNVFMVSIITILVYIATAVIYVEFLKINEKKGISSLLTSEGIKSVESAIDSINRASIELSKKQSEIRKLPNDTPLIETSGGNSPNTLATSNNSIDKILETVTPVLLVFSAILFVVYILRLFIIFLKYNMQMNNDYDNQKISFLLSGGDTTEFGELLQKVRGHNISFEKTPVLPQEKIVSELIELVKSVKGKN